MGRRNIIYYFLLKANEKWHGFEGYGKRQYFIDSCKLNLLTYGINIEKGEYEDFGIPACFVAHYLRENMIIPEKCDLNEILFNIKKMKKNTSSRKFFSRKIL